MIAGFSSVMTPEGWLSTWSALSSRAAALENIKKVEQPLLVVSFTGDSGILPHEAEGMFESAATTDKKLFHVDADHYGFARSEPREAPIIEGAGRVTQWLKHRFPART
jgi:hypothetical protein